MTAREYKYEFENVKYSVKRFAILVPTFKKIISRSISVNLPFITVALLEGNSIVFKIQRLEFQKTRNIPTEHEIILNFVRLCSHSAVQLYLYCTIYKLNTSDLRSEPEY